MTIFDRRSSSHRDSTHRPRLTDRASRRRFAPALHPLEGRALLSTLVVTDNHDSGPGSLRQAIHDAHSGDTVTFAPNLRGETITLTSGELEVSQSLNIDGPGADQLAVSGDDSSRVFEISRGANVSISGLTITDGEAAQGGGIFNSGALTLKHCVVAANRAAATAGGTAQGGGIYSAAAALTILDCTLTSPGPSSRDPPLFHRPRQLRNKLPDLAHDIPMRPGRAASDNRRTIALPTIRPSATGASCRTWSGPLIPNPTQIGKSVWVRSQATASTTSSGKALRSPVIPATET